MYLALLELPICQKIDRSDQPIGEQTKINKCVAVSRSVSIQSLLF